MNTLYRNGPSLYQNFLKKHDVYPFEPGDFHFLIFFALTVLTRAPLGSAEQRAPLGGPYWPPEISRTTQRSDKRQTALDSPWRELSKACKFYEIEGHGAGQTEVKGQYYSFLQWRLLRPNKAL